MSWFPICHIILRYLISCSYFRTPAKPFHNSIVFALYLEFPHCLWHGIWSRFALLDDGLNCCTPSSHSLHSQIIRINYLRDTLLECLKYYQNSREMPLFFMAYATKLKSPKQQFLLKTIKKNRIQSKSSNCFFLETFLFLWLIS
jgi:hypothetical protein